MPEEEHPEAEHRGEEVRIDAVESRPQGEVLRDQYEGYNDLA